MTEQERFLLKHIPPLTDEELQEIPAMLAKAIAQNAGSFGNTALIAQLWKALMSPPISELEIQATAILDLWDMRVLTVYDPLQTNRVTTAMIQFRDALRDLRVERFNQQLSAKETYAP